MCVCVCVSKNVPIMLWHAQVFFDSEITHTLCLKFWILLFNFNDLWVALTFVLHFDQIVLRARGETYAIMWHHQRKQIYNLILVPGLPSLTCSGSSESFLFDHMTTFFMPTQVLCQQFLYQIILIVRTWFLWATTPVLIPHHPADSQNCPEMLMNFNLGAVVDAHCLNEKT